MRAAKITLIVLAFLLVVVWAQPGSASKIVGNRGDDIELSAAALGEDTVICLDDPKRDTVYTLDDEVLDVKPTKVALSETYYPVAPDVVVVDVTGKEISYEMLPIKATVRARFVKNDDGEFVIKRIRVLKNPR